MIDEKQLKEILEKHRLWLSDKEGGEKADLRGADLSGTNLGGTDLGGADLRRANLGGADLSCANLSGTNLSGADLRRANLSGANLSGTNLGRANLSCANLRCANLSCADLSCADLSGADLSCANLSGADLSCAKGLLNAIDYLEENFDKTAEGYIVYKAFGMYYTAPDTWEIKEGAVIEENANPNRAAVCSCGINVATKEWIKKEKPDLTKAWKMLIKWEWLPGVVVPYNTDGKIRCERAMLLEEVEI